MPMQSHRSTLPPLAHGPAPVTRGERRPVPPWRLAAAAWLVVVGGALLLHGALRWQAGTQVAGLAGAVWLAGHPSWSGRANAVALVVAVVLVDVLGTAVPGLGWL